MATAHDVAKYILEGCGRLSMIKLQKLVYYTQAWSLVWDDEPLFTNRIEAWAGGPVVPDLYDIHKGEYSKDAWPCGNTDTLDENQRDTINKVIDFYAKYNAQQLSDLTHHEQPWRDARLGVPEGVDCINEISLASMAEYYGGLS